MDLTPLERKKAGTPFCVSISLNRINLCIYFKLHRQTLLVTGYWLLVTGYWLLVTPTPTVFDSEHPGPMEGFVSLGEGVSTAPSV